MKITHKVNKSVDFVFGHLTDVNKFVSVHPVIYKMENLGNNNYLVYETLKFLFIPISFTYYASIESDTINQRVIMKAVVMKVNKITMTFALKKTDDYTFVEEEVVFTSAFPVKTLMEKIFRKQHSTLFKNIGLLSN